MLQGIDPGRKPIDVYIRTSQKAALQLKGKEKGKGKGSKSARMQTAGHQTVTTKPMSKEELSRIFEKYKTIIKGGSAIISKKENVTTL